MKSKNFSETLLEWYSSNNREFFWRSIELDSFKVLVLETLLKRTNIRTVQKPQMKVKEIL